ncbi:MAG: hypothetical protein QOD99_788 [Chthoniobacter sp.]|jgi:hypothetical protein|nr:hypothetical protein [Chthoniobacter sp.]
MSPQAGLVLVQEIAPRLKSAIAHCVKPVGAEDAEELLQDGITVAAQMLHNLELRGKVVTPGNVAYYTLLHLKSGRRSNECGRTDVMASATQLDHKSCVLSVETEVGYDPELDEPVRLGELLTCSKDDPSMEAGRNLDWEAFIETHDYRYGVIVKSTAEGESMVEAAKECHLNYSTAIGLRNRLARELKQFMGEEAVADSVRVPAWRGNIMADKEKAACRVDRRRS